jgi:hypothetical protein
MAKLWITEYAHCGSDGNGTRAPIASHPPVAVQTPIDITGTSAQSAAFNGATRFVRLRADVACHFAVGANPTATTDATPLDASAAEYFGLAAAGHKIAVIAAA